VAGREIAVKKYVVRLSAEERQQLSDFIRSGRRSAQLLTKARILLKADVSEAGEGWSDKILDGSQAGVPTFHGILIDADCAGEYPEIVVAYLRAAIEANRLLSDEPEKCSELIAKVTGIEASVSYLFPGPLGLQTRDLTWKQEYRKDVATAVETLELLKRADTDLDLDAFITEKYIRAVFEASPSTMTRASPIMRRRF
jgi:hypothetical protein